MITLYPVRDVRFYDDASEASMALVQKIIVAVARHPRRHGTSRASARLTALLAVNDDYKKTILEGYKKIIAEQAQMRRGARAARGASFSGEFVARQAWRRRWPATSR